MKSVKFKDLPERVQVFINRVFEPVEKTVSADAEIDLEWLHTLSKWSKATDDELLEYARWRFPKGVSFLSAMRGDKCISANGILYGEMGYLFDHNGNAVYNGETKKWAEIIEEPDALTKAKQALHDHIQSNPEKVKQDLDKMRDLSNEFKAGDEVDGSHNSRFYTDESFIYTGGKNTKGEFICEQKVTGRLFAFTEIRKTDPDAKLKEIAKEIMFKNPIPVDVISDEQYLSYLTIQRIEQMLIEALKKGKEL